MKVLRAQVVNILILAVVALVAAYSARQGSQIDDLAIQTHDTLCTFKRDLEVRYETGLQFLQEHPNGIPGISAADIQRSLTNQLSSLDSLSELECVE